jgi:hypothetical protein
MKRQFLSNHLFAREEKKSVPGVTEAGIIVVGFEAVLN